MDHGETEPVSEAISSLALTDLDALAADGAVA
jgi:hypothetical protein